MRSATTLASKAEIDSKPMTASPLSNQNQPVTARVGALRFDTRRPFGFNNPPLRQYNPLYLRSAIPIPESLGRAA